MILHSDTFLRRIKRSYCPLPSSAELVRGLYSHALKGSYAPGSASCHLLMGIVALSPTNLSSLVSSPDSMEQRNGKRWKATKFSKICV